MIVGWRWLWFMAACEVAESRRSSPPPPPSTSIYRATQQLSHVLLSLPARIIIIIITAAIIVLKTASLQRSQITDRALLRHVGYIGALLQLACLILSCWQMNMFMVIARQLQGTWSINQIWLTFQEGPSTTSIHRVYVAVTCNRAWELEN